jgi:hypothetical protein
VPLWIHDPSASNVTTLVVNQCGKIFSCVADEWSDLYLIQNRRVCRTPLRSPPTATSCLTEKENKQLTDEEREYKRKLVQEKLIKFATRIPAFMYLTDFRENTLQDVITKLEPDLFLAVTGLTVKDFHLLVDLKIFNTEQMNQAVFAFRRYEDASLRYTGIESHEGLSHYGRYDTVVARE